MSQTEIEVANLTPDQRERLMTRLLETRGKSPLPVCSPDQPVKSPEDGLRPVTPKLSGVPPHIQFESRPLCALIKEGKIPPVEAAALGYWPDEWLNQSGLSREMVIDKACNNRAITSTILETEWGRIAAISLPKLHSELYTDPGLVDEIVAALVLAGDLGARSVSLTGLLPSATDYGNAIIRAIPEGSTLPRITTGHAMTAASVVLNIGKIVTEAGRTLPQERVAFLGLGSIGLTSLRLLLQSSPHPQSLVLCDLFHKSESLQAIRDEILGDMGFQGDIKLIAVHDELPPAVYEASLFVGATNVPDVLDVQQLRPGSLIVDDSGPHCFNLRQAKERIARQADILFTEGGAVRLPAPVRELWHVPLGLETVFAADWATEPNLIMGCVLSSLLSAKMSTLSHTVGAVEPDIGLNFYRKLEQLGTQAAPLHGENYVLPSDLISTFRARTSVEG